MTTDAPPEDRHEPTTSTREPASSRPLVALSPSHRDRLALRLLRVAAGILSDAGEFDQIDRRWVERHLHILPR